MIKPIASIVVSALSIFLLGTMSVSAVNKKNDLPEIGVVASSAISLDKEVLIGDALMRQLRGQAPIINDPLLDEYIQDIGNRLVAQADNVKFPYKFFILNSPDINAFAFFGGHIGIHTGLIFNARNESELASVLAHEVSHVTQRHIARSIEARQKSSPLQIASLLGSILVAVVNPEAGMAALSVSNAASAQSSINYTRQNEKEADRVGIGILAEAGFDPNGASSFFGILAEKNRLKSSPLAFLLTHPLPESRIADARTRAASFRPREIPESINFHLAKTRIIARYYANPKRNIEYFSDILQKQSYVFKQAAEYGLVLSYLANEQFEPALKLIDMLLEKYPDNLFYLDTYTDIAIEMNQHQKAIDKLSAQIVHAPFNQVLTLNLANVLIKFGNFERSISLLKDYLLINPDNMLAYDLLSDAYRISEQKLEMHQVKAEVYALVAAYPRAIDELHTAYNYADERNIEKQRIRARIEQFRTAQERLQTL
ncbi:M48 family metalloprotease [Paraglaciecola sp. MB-3u-78]|jgi:predicted Zn-dependent protease|uniref:beta-barrel assembly-enhancing protease n=1 Tax=Paraglaciecola sp. MB-3u-78 TaxID=2058332 RepID=UPI000C34E0AD|nr:M48 family metalloprotease [Paraglaciecola sp. MB-3u-78]PKG97444.1 peptidase M48 [Paraglaciecola sp. MB-3u-78]